MGVRTWGRSVAGGWEEGTAVTAGVCGTKVWVLFSTRWSSRSGAGGRKVPWDRRRGWGNCR